MYTLLRWMKENLVIQVSKQHINVESVTFFIKKKKQEISIVVNALKWYPVNPFLLPDIK